MTSIDQVRYSKLIALTSKPANHAQVRYNDDNSRNLLTLTELTIDCVSIQLGNMLKFCTNLTSLDIKHLGLLDSQYSIFARLPNLINLGLHHVMYWNMLPVKLQSLRCPITYEFLDELNRFTLLVSLKIHVTRTFYQQSSFNPSLPQLKHLELDGYVTTIGADVMMRLETLTFCSHDSCIRAYEQVPVDLAMFENATNMTHLNLKLQSSSFTLDHFQHMTRLVSLQVHIWDKTDVLDLAPLQHLTSLKSLHLSNVWVTSLGPLQHLQLESIDITDPNTTILTPLIPFHNYDWDALNPSRLTHLKLHTRYHFQDNQEEQSILSKFTNLKSLDYNNLKAISSITSLTNLTSLAITNNRGMISTLDGIQHLRQLVTVIISVWFVVNSDLLYLKDLPLQQLTISNSRLSSLTNIATFTSLQVLSLDVDVGDDLIELEPLIHLRDLSLNKTSPSRYHHYTHLDNIKPTQIPFAIIATLRKLTNLNKFYITRKIRGKYMRLHYKKGKVQLDH